MAGNTRMHESQLLGPAEVAAPLPRVTRSSRAHRPRKPMAFAIGSRRLDMSGYAQHAVLAAVVMTTFLACRLSEVLPGSHLLRPVLTSTIICAVYMYQRTRRDILLRTLRHPVSLALMAYLFIATVGVPFALLRSAAFGALSTIAFCGLLTISIMLVPPTVQSLDKFTRWTVLAAGMVSASWVAGGGTKSAGRLTSAGSYDPNDLAAMMCLFLPLAMGMAFRGKFLWRVVGAGGAAVFATIIVLSSSRGGLVAFGVIVLTFLFTMKPSRAVVTVMLAGPLLIGIWTIAPAQFKSRASTLENVDEDYNVTLQTGRIAIWKRGWMHFKSAPILGVGAGNYSVAEGNFFQSTNTVAAYFTAHNTYIQAFVEFGFFGGCAVCFLVFYAIGGAYRAARRSYNGVDNPFHRPEYLSAMTGYFSAAFFLSHAFVYLLFAAVGIGTLVRQVQIAVMRADRRFQIASP